MSFNFTIILFSSDIPIVDSIILQILTYCSNSLREKASISGIPKNLRTASILVFG